MGKPEVTMFEMSGVLSGSTCPEERCRITQPAPTGQIDVHQQMFGRPPRLVSADAGFFSLRNEVDARERGVKRVAILDLGTKSAERRGLHKNVGRVQTFAHDAHIRAPPA